MKILTIGDIVGEEVLKAIEDILPKLKEKYNIDFVIANGENIVNARGINKHSFYKLIDSGVDVVTMGNHTYSNEGIYEIDDKRLLVPVNYRQETIEKGYGIFECKGQRIFVSSVLGKKLGAELNAFLTIESVVENIDDDIKIRIIDFHSEYGNEKKALAYFLKGKISALYGTHTHIQTADEQILSTGEGYITDIGMCGSKESAIGYDINFEIKRFKEETKEDSKLAKDDEIIINGCIFEIDENTGKTIKIERVNI